MQELFLHVGMPKTGTTLLQRDVYPKFSGYVGKYQPHRTSKCLQGLHDLWHQSMAGVVPSPQPFRAWASQLPKTPTVVLSEELLAQWPREDVDLPFPLLDEDAAVHPPRVGRPPVVRFVAAMQDALTAQFRIKVVLTLRRQVDFFPSLYAQLSNRMHAPSSHDFALKMKAHLASGDHFGEFDRYVTEFERTLGSEGLLVLLLEDGVDVMVNSLQRFLREDRPVRLDQASEANTRRKDGTWTLRGTSPLARVHSHASSLANAVWPPSLAPDARAAFGRRLGSPLVRLRGLRDDRERERGGTLYVSSELKNCVRLHFATSNQRLSLQLGRDLSPLGYY